MGSQHSSRSQATRKHESVKQTTTELDFIFKRPIFWRPSYIAQSSWLEHIPFAFWLVDTLRPRKIVELGTHYGSSYFSFCQAITKLDLGTQCYAVDTWGGDEHAGQYGEEVYRQVSEHNQQHYSDFSTLVRSTFDQALEHFPQSSIDLLHIDGLHTLEAVRHDFESWLPKLSDRAVVIMHDTNVRERGFGVFQLMDELKQQYPHFEFAHGHGLGVIGVGSEQSSEMMSLYDLSGNASATKQVQEVFSRLGKACGHSWENNELKRQIMAQQAGAQEDMEQQALERGRLAERITTQHHTLKELEGKLQQHADQSVELAQLKRNATDIQTALIQCEQQRDKSLASQQNLESKLADTRHELTQRVAERDLVAQEQLSALQQVDELTNALKSAHVQQDELTNALKAAHVQQDELTNALKAAHVQQDELSQTLATETCHWQKQQQTMIQTHSQLQTQCDGLTADLEARADEIINLTQTIDMQSIELGQTRNQLVQKQEELFNQESVLKERFDEIATLTGWLEEREQALAIAASEQQNIKEEYKTYQQTWRDKQLQYQTEQAEHQQQLEELKQALSERFIEIATLTGWLEDYEKILEKSSNEYKQATQEHNVHQQLWRTEQQQLTIQAEQATQQQDDLHKQISELVKRNKELETNIAERFRELAIITSLAENQSRELRNSEQQTEQLKARINKLKGTVSWRMTAPVRALAKPFKEAPKHSISQINTIFESGFFDEQWYRQQYPDSLNASSAIEHYLNTGAKNCYNPSPKFDTSWYLNMYPDVANGEVNPLLHYILHGQHEGRLCRSQP